MKSPKKLAIKIAVGAPNAVPQLGGASAPALPRVAIKVLAKRAPSSKGSPKMDKMTRPASKARKHTF